MNIEIANRLVKMRKEKGYSQEELADALGISRQAVSKWERAEASPDTDNLICLAKLYNVSLDDLLSSDESIESIREEQKEKTAEVNAESVQQQKKHDSVYIGKDGIHITDKDGSEVHINKRHIRAIDVNGKEVKNVKRTFRASSYLEGILYMVALIGYMLIGFFTGYWFAGWILFFLPEVICSLIRCFETKNPERFNICFLACYIFFLTGFVHPGGIWHPMWVIFLTIPVYYMVLDPFKPKNRVNVDCCDSDVEIIDQED